MSILIKELPMPPIVNHRLMPSRGRLIKAPEARVFDKAIQLWMIRKKGGLFEMRRQVKEWIDVGYCLHMSLDFFWQKEKLISKNGIPKKNDLDGRIKSTIDAISEIIDVDDKFIIEIHAKKLFWTHGYDEVNAIIRPIFWSELCQ